MCSTTKQRRRIDAEALKRGRPLPDVIATYGIALRREGTGTFRALCPFHQERTPSFWVDARDDSNAHYFCFGCHEHGDVITFVMAHEACSFHEACERLSSRARPPVVEPSLLPAARAAGRRWEDLAADSPEALLLDRALRLYQSELWASERAQGYLKQRGVSEAVARAQRLGYADGRALLRCLRRDSTDNGLLQCAVDLGLVMQRPGGDDTPLFREFFVDRLIVPELRLGSPIWCIGRSLEHSAETAGAAASSAPTGDSALAAARPRPKYLGLPGEKPVMGLEQVVGRQVAFLVEGRFDMLAAMGWQLPAFAIGGTHFPADRLPALAEALVIYGVFDPDRAGLSAAERFAPLFGSRWRPVRLPNGLDLAELAALGASGREIFDTLVGRARAAAWQRGQT